MFELAAKLSRNKDTLNKASFALSAFNFDSWNFDQVLELINRMNEHLKPRDHSFMQFNILKQVSLTNRKILNDFSTESELLKRLDTLELARGPNQTPLQLGDFTRFLSLVKFMIQRQNIELETLVRISNLAYLLTNKPNFLI